MIPPELQPMAAALVVAGMTALLQAWLNRREREARIKAGEAEQKDKVSQTLERALDSLTEDYNRIKLERDELRQEVRALRRALRSNGIHYDDKE